MYLIENNVLYDKQSRFPSYHLTEHVLSELVGKLLSQICRPTKNI